MPRRISALGVAVLVSLCACAGYLAASGWAAAPAGGAAPATRAGGRGGAGRGAGRPTPSYPPFLTTPLADADKQSLQAGVDKLAGEVAALKAKLTGKLADRVADVEIYLDAVRLPLTYGEVMTVPQAKAALATGEQRAAELAQGQTPWTLTDSARGYYSKIDGSAQPYLLNLPTGFKSDDAADKKLFIFCRGRTDSTTELAFLSQRSGWGGKPVDAAADKFLLQPYGRFCNANRFAGEIDGLEAIQSVENQYHIDLNRVVMTGFSMGGASAWQYATHYSDMWAATSAGAGFSETRRFLNLRSDPVWYQLTLWHMYDSVDYAGNLFNVPMVAYAGEIDPQKQASDAMLTAMDAEGLKLERIIGPNTAHAYEPNARKQLAARLDELATKGRDPSPREIKFTTWTLRYNHMFWVVLDGLGQHWDRARADAKVENNTVTMKTVNVTALHLNWTAGLAPWAPGATATLNLDGDPIALPAVAADKSLNVALVKSPAGHWQIGTLPATALLKRPGLQGPIDDAFMDSFIIVRPTGQPLNAVVGKWTLSEADRAIQQWHSFFRGEPRVKTDADITDADIAASNLVLFGDPSSNAVLKRVVDRLGIQWNAKTVTAGAQSFPSDTHVPVFIYPNPLNPAHYVVINSGFTFHDQSNNDRQNSKLPDWAVVDTSQPGAPDNGVVHIPAAIKAAGFFDENWMVKNHP